MRVRLSDPALIPDLRQHFERSGFVTTRVDESTVEVWQPGAPAGTTRGQIELHLGLWRAMHPDVEAEAL